MAFTTQRSNHSISVAKLMYDTSLREHSEEYAKEMFLLGWLHDIGYQFTNNNKMHPFTGGEFLRIQGYKYWEEVFNHGNPDSEYKSDELDLLNYADMHVNGVGQVVTFEERLKDIENRYGKDSIEYCNTERVINNLPNFED